ncbi:carboxymuconolactone decarboxylase family protein [Actinomadura macrotermitis]|uniref:Carboxymuconolactone decarboxylase-like domain-containing protein n=1 Tax=Actinomadura macrotermitis TaxID=2585200 RepID=A0A7K0BST9_9ACTN|nr:carboxymuconolactone decarboxylase family protein [Actinomadura macrotermitis]MQY03744.1 hypothetical protein [Actinomadura macrotermitis]
MPPRIEPADPQADEKAAGVLAAMTKAIGLAEPLQLFTVVARHPELAAALTEPTTLLIQGARTDRAERELVILRTCALADCRTEWGIHATALLTAGLLTEDRLDATWSGADPGWTDRERLALDLAESLHRTADLDDDLWRRCRAVWSDEEALELIAAAGHYRLVSLLANATRVPAEPWARRVPGSAA